MNLYFTQHLDNKAYNLAWSAPGDPSSVAFTANLRLVACILTEIWPAVGAQFGLMPIVELVEIAETGLPE